MKKPLFLCLFMMMLSLLCCSNAFASTPITILDTKSETEAKANALQIKAIIISHFNLNLVREVRVQLIVNKKHKPDHLLVYLLSKTAHKVEMARVDIDNRLNVLAVRRHYRLDQSDIDEQPGVSSDRATCPDNAVEFISFCPNDDKLEQHITVKVAKAAEEHALKTVRLLLQDATRQNYLNYMRCPKLKGNFYDGDANPQLITTVDGVLSYSEIEKVLNNQFNYKVTNIWLACEAFNDPMKTTMLTTVQSQKYAAGINDLLVGPSDRAAACAMIAGIERQPLTESFEACVKKHDTQADKWGFDGEGSDQFGE